MDEENVTGEQKQTQETTVEETKQSDTKKIEENAEKPTEATGTTDEKKPEEEKRPSVTITPSDAKPAEEKRTSDAKKPEEEKRASILKKPDVSSTEEKRHSESKTDERDKRLSQAKRVSEARPAQDSRPSDAKKEEPRESDAGKRKSRRQSEARSIGERKSMVMETGGRQSVRSQLTEHNSFSRTKVRKQSYGFGSIPGIKPVDRTSQTLEFKRPPLIYLNTYQLEPHVRFNNQQVEDAAQELMDENFTGHVYNEARSPLLAVRLSGELMRRVKHLLFNRYRIIVAVTIAQRRAQSYNNAIAFLWDRERDSYVDLHRENFTCFMQITVFGVYLD